jgi:hypothetical protein
VTNGIAEVNKWVAAAELRLVEEEQIPPGDAGSHQDLVPLPAEKNRAAGMDLSSDVNGRPPA